MLNIDKGDLCFIELLTFVRLNNIERRERERKKIINRDLKYFCCYSVHDGRNTFNYTINIFRK